MKDFIIILNCMLWMLIFGVMGLICLYLFTLWSLHGYSPYFLQIDRCLDYGGGWNYETNICEYEEK